MAGQHFLQFLVASTFVLQRCNALLAFTCSLTGLTAGAQFNVVWSGAIGTVKLTLQNETAGVVNTINVISCELSPTYSSSH